MVKNNMVSHPSFEQHIVKWKFDYTCSFRANRHGLI